MTMPIGIFWLKILKDMGFGNKWINCIDFFISNEKFSMLINRSPKGAFHSQRGFRDPMSPFLFLLVMEDLNHMIRTAKSNYWNRGFGSVQLMAMVWKSPTYFMLITLWVFFMLKWTRLDISGWSSPSSKLSVLSVQFPKFQIFNIWQTI